MAKNPMEDIQGEPLMDQREADFRKEHPFIPRGLDARMRIIRIRKKDPKLFKQIVESHGFTVDQVNTHMASRPP